MFHWKYWHKVRLEIYFIEKTKIRPGRDIFMWKSQSKVQFRVYIIEKAQIRYSSGYSIQQTKITDCWGFISLKLLKKGMTGDFLLWKGQRRLWLGIYSKEQAKSKIWLRIYFTENFELGYGYCILLYLYKPILRVNLNWLTCLKWKFIIQSTPCVSV